MESADLLPAASVATATKFDTPSVNEMGAVQPPLLSAVTVPLGTRWIVLTGPRRICRRRNIATSAPASAVPVTVNGVVVVTIKLGGVTTAVVITGAAGAVVSSVTVTAADAADTLPAVSLAVAIDQSPLVSASVRSKVIGRH